MKNKIVEESIMSLQKEGLRFSVDMLAEKLRVSKKTIYKYFPTKEALAYAIYERYYADLREEIKAIIPEEEQVREEKLFLCYFASAKMVRKELFNKYSLNDTIGSFALQQHLAVWNAIGPYLCNGMTKEEAAIYKLIIDGAFDRAVACEVNAVQLIGMLRKMK
ncbi:MAG: TetR/AcrR family transcriptional regulator [Lachnospiraceae bacterium]